MAFWRFRRRGAGFTTEQRLRALVGQAPSIFFALDRQGRPRTAPFAPEEE